MNDKNKKMKDKTNNKKTLETAKKHVNNNVAVEDMPIEGACSPEFPQGCIVVDDEINW